MSAVIKTLTPFVEQDVLLEALSSLGVECHVKNNLIMTDRVDYQGTQHFQINDGVYQLVHDSDELQGRLISDSLSNKYTAVKQFLGELEIAYKSTYQLKLTRAEEAERLKMERARQARVAEARGKAIAQAKEQGYSVKESHVNGKIKLVLTRTSH